MIDLKKHLKTLVICGCSKSKKNITTKAINLYEGQIFNSIKKYAEINGYELFILSAKYGLIEKNEIIEPYDKTLKNKRDITELSEKIKHSNIFQKIKNYERIELIMGNKYTEAILPLIQKLESKYEIYQLSKENGIFDFKKNLRKLLDNDFSVLKKI